MMKKEDQCRKKKSSDEKSRTQQKRRAEQKRVEHNRTEQNRTQRSRILSLSNSVGHENTNVDTQIEFFAQNYIEINRIVINTIFSAVYRDNVKYIRTVNQYD